jgi:thioredoxin
MKQFFLLGLIALVISCNAQNSASQLSAIDFQKKIATTPNPVLIDVRTPDEVAGGALENAVNIDYRDPTFQQHIQQLNTESTYFVYCLSGGRSSSAAAFMRDKGFKNVYELKGGILAWQSNNLPITTGNKTVKADAISAEAYEKLIHSDKVVLVDFYAPWCGPCKKMEPLLAEMSTQFKGKATIARINIDENKALTKKLRIDEIPFFKLYVNGEEKGNYIGELDKATFERILNTKN